MKTSDEVGHPRTTVAADAESPSISSPSLTPGSASIAAPPMTPKEHRLFVMSIVMMMGMAAVSIDVMLPAFKEMREDFGMEPGSASVTWVITAFFLGMAIGPWFFGPPSDRFGRKPPLAIGMTLYTVAAIACAVAPNFELLVVGRFALGLAAGAPRTLSTAMLRDRFVGAEMARLMSTAMAVFMIVPVLAPGLGSAVMAVAPWRAVMWIPVAMGVLMIFWTRQLPETLPPERRRPFNRASVYQAVKLVVTTRETLCFGLAAAFLFGVMSGYLTNSELILEGVYGYGKWFSLFFGAVATTFAVAALTNARFVGRVGLYRWTRRVSLLTLTTSAVFALVAALTDGKPPFWLMTVTLVAFIPTIQALIPNCNTAALVPLSQVAGTASALTGTATTAIGSLIGNRLSAAFDDTTRPYAYGALACVVIAVSLIRLGVPAASTSK